MMRPVCFFVAIMCVFSGSSWAGWVEEKNIDSLSGNTKIYASIKNDEGFTLRIFRKEDNKVWCSFSLPSSSFDLMGKKPPMLRIDDHTPVDLSKRIVPEIFKNISSEDLIQKEKETIFVLFHGQGPADTGTLREIMDGKSLNLRYFLNDGGHKETGFSLIGAKKVISSALNIPENADENVAKRESDFIRVYKEANKKCMEDRKNFPDCLKKLLDCGARSKQNADEFRKCINE